MHAGLRVNCRLLWRSPLETAGRDIFQAYREHAEVIEADRYGEKVLRLKDGRMLKLFRRKRLISSATWYPYAQRFADNCQGLAIKEILSPTVIAVYRFPDLDRDAVLYHPLAGKTIRQLIKEGLPDNEADQLKDQLRNFVKSIQDRGVYFRSLHLGNIVRTADGDLGLIDVSDMVIKKNSLGRLVRKRNLNHLLRYVEDAEWLREGNPDWFSFNEETRR